jgi:hypothetical protein
MLNGHGDFESFHTVWGRTEIPRAKGTGIGGNNLLWPSDWSIAEPYVGGGRISIPFHEGPYDEAETLPHWNISTASPDTGSRHIRMTHTSNFLGGNFAPLALSRSMVCLGTAADFLGSQEDGRHFDRANQGNIVTIRVRAKSSVSSGTGITLLVNGSRIDWTGLGTQFVLSNSALGTSYATYEVSGVLSPSDLHFIFPWFWIDYGGDITATVDVDNVEYSLL